MCFPCFLLRCSFAGRSVRRLFDLRCCWRTGCCHMVALEVKKCSSRSMWFFFFFFFFLTLTLICSTLFYHFTETLLKNTSESIAGKGCDECQLTKQSLDDWQLSLQIIKKKGSFLFPGSAPVRITYIEWATKCVSARFSILQRMTTWQVSHEVLENKQLLFHFFSDLQMARTVNILKNT